MSETRVFDTDRRIRLGLWGLGRGLHLAKVCGDLNMDIVAGCDLNEHMRAKFLEGNPGAFATANADEFLARDFDAVLLATFCPAHADDAIRCLEAGKHVLSEVTAFHTMAEGVRLVEAVERTGRVYNLAENYPFSAANMYLAAKYKEGLFGELTYAEYEYVHDCRKLSYTYIDGVPVQPGHTVHNWRSWINFHYYGTHSLGPVMYITGTRPVRVVSLPTVQRMGGFVDGPESQVVAPELILMSNGAVVRNLMGATTNDTHIQRLWGTRGAAEVNAGRPLVLRLGGSGESPKFEVTPHWPMLREHAERTGHGGGDFWVFYFFARQILIGERAPFDIYAACDMTIPGILARRSALEGGRPCDVPDFRRKEEREHYRHDDAAQPHLDPVNGVFPADADRAVTGQFSGVMNELLKRALQCRACIEWAKVAGELTDTRTLAAMIEKLIAEHPQICEAYRAARRIADACSDSPGGRALREVLEDTGYEQRVLSNDFVPWLRSLLRPPIVPVLPLHMLWPVWQRKKPAPRRLPRGYELRIYRPADEADYLQLREKAGFHGWTRDDVMQWERICLPDGFFVVVHRASRKVVASAMAVHRPMPRHPSGGELGWVVCDPDHRGNGLGRAVCATVTARFLRVGYRRIYLQTDDFRLPAIKTYLKLGYRPLLYAPDMEGRWKALCKTLGVPFRPAPAKA